MDDALVLGQIATNLPFIKKKGVELLTTTYKSREEAAEKLPSGLVSFYKQTYAHLYSKRSQDIQQAAQAILAIYNRNVFPDMKVTWGTYPNNLGHTEFPGCFRCHDGSHMTAKCKGDHSELQCMPPAGGNGRSFARNSKDAWIRGTHFKGPKEIVQVRFEQGELL